ncbi:hypothetical protein IscW_ISCW000949, partial [Ixodes scapularis]
ATIFKAATLNGVFAHGKMLTRPSTVNLNGHWVAEQSRVRWRNPPRTTLWARAMVGI